jgi:hypothetical protein
VTFTDDDLKRLKEMLNKCDCDSGHQTPTVGSHVLQKAVLARLEAAENLIALDKRYWEMYPTHYEAWRKAAGK